MALDGSSYTHDFSQRTGSSHPFDTIKPRIHDRWRLQEIPLANHTHFGHHIPAQKQSAADANVFFMPGCGTTATKAAFLPNILAKNGMNVFATRQFLKDERSDNIDANMAFIEFLFRDPRSPIRDMMQSDKPFYVVTHSSTPLMIHTQALLNDMNISRIDAKFSDSAFYDTAGAEKPQSSDFLSPLDRLAMAFKSKTYRKHAIRNWDKHFGEPALDRLVMAFKKGCKKPKGTALRGATHGEGLTYKEMGGAYYEELENVFLENPKHPALNVLEYSYAGTHDPASSNYATKGIAALRNRTTVLDTIAEHDSFYQDLDALRHMLTVMKYLNEAIPVQGRENLVIPEAFDSFAGTRRFRQEAQKAQLSGLDLTLQGGACFLDAGASLG